MSFLDFFWPSSKKQRQQANIKSLKFETLENREMLSITSILSTPYTDTISTAGSQAAMYLELTSSDSNKWITVGLNIEAAANSNLDPSKITVKYQNEDKEWIVVPNSAVPHETDGAKKSTIIVEVPAGTYQILVGGDNQTSGAFTADVYVPGATKESPTKIPQYTPVLAQAGLQQMSGQWNASMESIYKKLLGTNYRNNISADYPGLNVTETGRLNATDTLILGLVARSGDVTAKLTKTEPEPQPGNLTFSAASLSTTEKAAAFGDPTAAITVTGGSSTNLKDYNVTLSSTYTIASSYGGVNLSGVTLPTLVAGTDYKFEDGKFYFNPNGKFNFIPKGTTATLTLTFTATDKADSIKTGTGTITVAIVGANDTPVLDKSEVDITPGSTTPIDIWSEPWSTTTNGVTTYRPDEVALVIDGKEIKIGNTVIAAISDPDIGDTFEFATIGYPAGSVTFENSTWTLWNGTDANKKAVGEIRLSTDKKTLYYKAAGAREDSAFSSLGDGELSDKMKFTFTVTDNHKITSPAGEDKASESNTCAVEFQVRRKVDAQLGLSLTSTGTSSVSIKAQFLNQGEENPLIPCTAFFTIDYTGEKTLRYSFVDVTVTGSPGLTIPEAVKTALEGNALYLSGSGRTDGVIEFTRNLIGNTADQFLNGLTDDQFINISFKVKVFNWDSDSEYVLSETLHVVLRKSTDLVLPNAAVSVSQNDTAWVASSPVEITGGVKQVSPSFYDIVFLGQPTIEYPVKDGYPQDIIELKEGEDYKYEIVVMDAASGKLGVVFSFNPNGKFDFLEAGDNATVKFIARLDDTINPAVFCPTEWTVTIRGEEASIAPTFKSNVNLSIDENQPLTIEGKDVAESTKSGAELVIDEIRILVDDVQLINGTAPNPSVAVNGFYVISRPAEDEQTIQLKSGTILLLDAEGKVKFDPTGRTTKLSEYDASNPATYADEKITLLVKDISGSTSIATAAAQEFSIRVKGVNPSPAPTFKNVTVEDLASFQNEIRVITANDLATSSKSGAELRIKSITLIAEDVESVDGAALGSNNTLTRPQTGEITITFKTGAIIKFHSNGTLTFDPREVTYPDFNVNKPLEPYEAGRVNSYRDAILKIIVEDVSGATPVPTVTAQEFTIRAKGVIYPEFNSISSFSTLEDTPKTITAADIALTQTYKPNAVLVIEEVSIKAEDVEQVNGAAPGTAIEGMYKITRPTSGTQTILLKSGSLITLDAAGTVTFDPTGRLPEAPAEEKLRLLLKDISGTAHVVSKTTQEFTIQVQNIVTPVDPTFREDVNLSTLESNTLTIYGNNIARSEKENPALRIDEVYVKAEYVSKINGADPTEEPENGFYKIVRPEMYDNIITLTSGSLVRLTMGGTVTFDPSGRTGTLPPYDPSDPATYAEEKMSFLVRDYSFNPPTQTDGIQEFTIRVKGEPATETDGLRVYGGPFQVNTFATLAEIPENIDVKPTYRVDGAAVDTNYTFELVEIRSALEEDGEYTPSTASPFSVGSDGTILVNKNSLVANHFTMGQTAPLFTTHYYQITVKAVKDGTETELTVDIPLTLQYVAPPDVSTVTTLDGTVIAASAKWEVSKTANHHAAMEMTITDLNDFTRTGQWYTISEAALLDWKYQIDWLESWTKSQVEAGKGTNAAMEALYNDVARLLDPAGTALTFALNEQTDQLDFHLNAGSDWDFIGAGQSLELQYELIVMDKDYLGQAPVRFTIVVQG